MNEANPVTPRRFRPAATAFSPALVAQNDPDTRGCGAGRSSGTRRRISHRLPSRSMMTRRRPPSATNTAQVYRSARSGCSGCRGGGGGVERPAGVRRRPV